MKKEYVKPEVCVVKLEHQGCLLQASKPGYDSDSWSREMFDGLSIDGMSIDGLSSDGFFMEEQ